MDLNDIAQHLQQMDEKLAVVTQKLTTVEGTHVMLAKSIRTIENSIEQTNEFHKSWIDYQKSLLGLISGNVNLLENMLKDLKNLEQVPEILQASREIQQASQEELAKIRQQMYILTDSE